MHPHRPHAQTKGVFHMSNPSIAQVPRSANVGTGKHWMPVELSPNQAFPIEIRITPEQFNVALAWADQTHNAPDLPRMIVEVFPQDKDARAICRKLVEKSILIENGRARHYLLSDLARAHVEYYRDREAR